LKTELEPQDIEAIALKVVEMLKPFLKGKGKAQEEDVVFDVPGLAQYLRVDPSWVYKQVSLKNIPYFKNGKYTRFKKSAIDKWIDSQTVRPIPHLKG
jgi:excisionase family DNA binding protein